MGKRGPALTSAFFSSRRALLSKRSRKGVSAPSRPPGPGRGTSGPRRTRLQPPPGLGAADGPPVPEVPVGRPCLFTHLAARSPTRTRSGNPGGPPQPTERRAPAGRAGRLLRACARAGDRSGETLAPDSAARRRAGACFPPPPRALRAHTNDGRDAGPSPRTQSRCRHPGAKFPHSGASAAAILPRGRRLLTLAPTRRASAPRRAFRARTEAAPPRFRAAAALRPLEGALDWLPARDLAGRG